MTAIPPITSVDPTPPPPPPMAGKYIHAPYVPQGSVHGEHSKQLYYSGHCKCHIWPLYCGTFIGQTLIIDGSMKGNNGFP